MEWLTKIFNSLKIPLKILLPAICLFSGLLTFLPDKALNVLSLLSWKTGNGFILGLMFLISFCLILIYAIYYLKEKISNLIFNMTLNRKTMKRLSKMDDTRLKILLSMYQSPGYSKVLNYSEPLVQALLSESYIYGGGEQLVSVNVLTNAVPVKFTLQPFVYKALDYYRQKIEDEISKVKRKINFQKNEQKKAKLARDLETLESYYNAYYNGGF